MYWGERLRLMMVMTRRKAVVLIWKRERHARWTIVPDKQYSYCKTKLRCQAQNVSGEAFQLHNRWRFVQDSLVHFRGQISLLKMTITFFTRATSSVFLSYTTKHEKFGIHFYTTEKNLSLHVTVMDAGE